MFLEHTRAKFVGFQVKQDQRSLAGLPQPIHEGVKVLKQVCFIAGLLHPMLNLKEPENMFDTEYL